MHIHVRGTLTSKGHYGAGLYTGGVRNSPLMYRVHRTVYALVRTWTATVVLCTYVQGTMYIVRVRGTWYKVLCTRMYIAVELVALVQTR